MCNIGPRWGKMEPKRANMSPRRANMSPKSLQEEPVLARNGKRERVRELVKHLGEYV